MTVTEDHQICFPIQANYSSAVIAESFCVIVHLQLAQLVFNVDKLLTESKTVVAVTFSSKAKSTAC